MPTVSIRRLVEAGDADEVFARLRDLERYPDITDGIQRVQVTWSEDGDSADSEWDVTFREGILRWVEHDTFDAENRIYRFEQTSGDLLEFSGSWTVEPAGDAVLVVFTADFDLGMPSLSAMLDPIAGRALSENIEELIDAVAASATAAL